MNKKYYLLICLMFLMCHFSAMTGRAATLLVTNNNDSGPGSLRQTISDANSGDTINFAANVKGTILLTGSEVEINKGINANLIINGPGANALSIESNLAFRVFRVQSGNIKISGLRISRGFAPNGFINQGGGIWVVEGANLTLESCWITGHQRGGIFTQSDSSLTISNSMIAGNEGGGVVGAGILNVSNSSISENTGEDGAGISWLNGVVTMSNVTVSGNNGIDGGGITINGATTAIVNCTIAFNRGGNGVARHTGGLRIQSGTVNLKNTIIADNDGFTPDVGGTVVSYGHNLVGDTDGSDIMPAPGASDDQLDVNAQLGAYANNGGTTYTVSLLTGSPAINGGDNCVLTAGCDPILPQVSLATDQRGVARPQGAGVDVGAYESGVRPPVFGKIVFVSDRDGNQEIYKMNADGTNQRRLTDNSAFDTEPDWSPDGSKIAFTTTRAGNSEIFTMTDTVSGLGSGLVNLTTSSAFEFEPAWSPDGTKIAYSRTTSVFANDYEIWVMDSNGANQTQLTNTAGQARAPSWSPDGTQIVFTSFPGGTNSIDVINADRTNRRTLLFSDADGVNLPAWSPDGNRIAYNNDVLGQTMYVANPFDTVGIPLRPLNNNHRANAPAWSPDGTKLAYHDPRSVGGIFIIDGDGTNPIRLVASSSTVSNESPDWFGFNTAAGSNIAVDLGTVDLNFSSITGPGTTTATPIDPASAGTMPGGYSLGAGLPAYEINTTASYTAPITVCLQVPSVTDPAVFSALRILHSEGGVLMDQTILPPDTPAPNFGTRTICARVNSLSPFVVAQSTAPQPTPSVVPAGVLLINESCSSNGQIDPGERVTINFKLRNDGGASSTNVIGTLQSGGGVLAPSGPQTYGVITPGEVSGRDFTFTVDPTHASGQPVLGTVVLQDGAASSPYNVSFLFIAGSSPCGGVRLVVTSTTLQRSGGIVTTLVTVQNIGTLPADQVTLASAMLGSASGIVAPSSLGTINIGASASAQVSFTTTATGSALLKFNGTYGPGVGGSGSLSSTKRVTTP